MSKETILSAALMIVPAVVLGEMASHILPLVPSFFSGGNWDSNFLSVYALFLGTYLFYILLNEYWRFGCLHGLKSQPVDFLLLAVMFVAIRSLSQNAGTVSGAFASLAVFLVALIVWEIVTMRAGYSSYFAAHRESLALKELFTLFFGVLKFDKDPRETTHWDEYRYWLISDSFLLLLVVAGWLVFSFTSGVPDFVPRICICCVGFLVGATNTWRYKVGEERWRSAFAAS